jgi:hypothetical protein
MLWWFVGILLIVFILVEPAVDANAGGDENDLTDGRF